MGRRRRRCWRGAACGGAAGEDAAGRSARAAAAAALFLAALGAHAEVLVVDLPGGPLECEASPSNWNQALDDAGQGPFEGALAHDPADPAACTPPLDAARLRGRLALLEVSGDCGGFVAAAAAAERAGALGVVFVQHGEGLGGIPLGDRAAPGIRAVLIEERHGRAMFEALARGDPVRAALRAGLIIAEDAYEEQFVFRADEIASTRARNFLWHQHPEMLPSAGGATLSERLFQRGLEAPSGWFSRPPSFVPLFNPSITALEDGSLLATLRISNGPGCPSVRRSKESSMDTRLFHNLMVLAHISADDLSVLSHTLVETPPLKCSFTANTKLSGRQFLDEVNGPMDVRLTTSTSGEHWVSFFAERNVPGSEEVLRGINAAPLHVEWRSCEASSEVLQWRLLRDGGTLAPGVCRWLGMGDGGSLDGCRASCDAGAGTGAKESCSAVVYRAGHCGLHACGSEGVGTGELPGWQVWMREAAPRAWGRGLHSCGWLGSGQAASAAACRERCTAHRAEDGVECDAVLYSKRLSNCQLQHCGSHTQGTASRFQVPAGWESWHWTAERRNSSCLGRAWLEPSEILIFPAESGVEKNWNLLLVEQERIIIEYHVEPHITLEASLVRPPEGGLLLADLRGLPVSRWPYEVIHGLSNVRGGFCCAALPAAAAAARPASGAAALMAARMAPGPLLLGVGHLQRIRQPFDQAPGDVNRHRRQAKSRTYHQFFYALRGTPPYDVVAVSTEWCITINGHFSTHWKQVLSGGEEACEAIQFASGLAMRGDSEVVVAYGINDCEADLLVLPLARILAMLRPVKSDLDVSLEDLEMI